jgi:PDZ domain-containing protein/BON domain-containing protein
MGKNGGKPHDTILTLEEALKRFARKRIENAETRNVTAPVSAPVSRVRYADFSPSVKREEDVGVGREHPPGDAAVVVAPAAIDAAKASSESLGDIVAVIDGVPRTLEDLERLEAADKAFSEDFPEHPTEPEFPEQEGLEDETIEPAMAHEFVRNNSKRDFVLGAMGAALLVWVAILVTRVPIINEPRIFAKAVPTPALKASSIKSAQELIATWVIIPDSEAALASNAQQLEPGELEAAIKDTLKTRAFTDIGVSVSHKGDAYLAGDVYSLAEARRIQQIARRVSGVRRVHFLHPDVHPAQGPAYFGVTAAWAPEVWGAKVQAVFIGSPADKAGLQPGDVISEFDGETVPDAKALDELIEQYSPGQRVQFRVWHGGQPVYLVARLAEMTTMASR